MRRHWFAIGVSKRREAALESALRALLVAAMIERRSGCIENARFYAKARRELLGAFAKRMTAREWAKRDTDLFIARLERAPRRRRKRAKSKRPKH